MRIQKIYKLIITTLFLAFNVCLVLFPAEVLESAREGLLLWFNRVLPSLLPFAVGIGVLTKLGTMKIIGSYLSPVMEPLFNLPGAAGAALIAGLTSGYPMGAMAAADLRGARILTGEEAQRLAGFCNNAGPLFIVGFAGTAMFGNAAAGYKILTAHIISALMLGIGLGFTSKRKRRLVRRGTNASYKDAGRADFVSIGSALGCTVKNAMESMALIGGLIIFFSVLTRLLDVLGIVNGLAGGVLEITNGVKALAYAENVSFNSRLALTAGMISFGGLSVHAQAAHFLSQAEISAGHYFICKIIHGLLAAFIMLLL